MTFYVPPSLIQTLYASTLTLELHNVFLTTSEVIHLWEAQSYRVQTQSVEFVEQSTCGKSGCTRIDSTLLWTVPKYTANMTVDNINSVLTPVANPPPTLVEPAIHTSIPPLDTLRKLHKDVKKKFNAHLIFIYRHSDTPFLDSDHDEEHMESALNIENDIHTSGLINVLSFAILCGRGVKGSFISSFGHDITIELQLVISALFLTARTSNSLDDLMLQVEITSEFTLRLKS
jgi:hypothetical protein